MKSFFTFLIAFMGFSFASLAMGQATDPGNKPPVEKPILRETYFFKAGAGSFLLQADYKHFNRPDTLGIKSTVTRTYGLGGFTGSAAVGIDCPDRFSYFISSEWLARDWSIMANVQYAFTKLNPVKPYLYLGIGFDLSEEGAIGGGVQLGVGANYLLSQNLDLFIEAKSYAANVYFDSVYNHSKNFKQWAGYLPVLTGIKYSL